MKKSFGVREIAALSAAVLMIGGSALASETEQSAAPAAAGQTEGAAQAGAAALSDDLYSFQIQVGDDVLTAPMTYAEFTASGWKLSSDSDAEQKLDPNQYTWLTFTKDGLNLTADIINLGINQAAVTDGIVGGFTIDASYDFNLDMCAVTLPGGIEMGKATRKDIEAAYGTPSDLYEGDLYDQMTYSKDTYSEVELYVYKEEGVLLKADVQNFTEPEGFEAGEVSTEVPDEVTAYKAPDALGDKLLDPEFEFCGDLYSLPCPLTALLGNGWTLSDAKEDDALEGGGFQAADIMKDNQTVHIYLYNMTSNATALKNCFLEEIELGTYDGDNLTLKLSGGVELGMSKADIQKLAEESGFKYEQSDDKNASVYVTEDSKYDKELNLGFYDDENPDKITSIDFSNRNFS